MQFRKILVLHPVALKTRSTKVLNPRRKYLRTTPMRVRGNWLRHGLSISQTYIGAAIHADDLRTIAESKEAVKKQASVISTFAKAVKLKLNSSKVEVLRISRKKHDPEVIQLGDIQLPTTSAVKCLGVWWQYNLSASRAVLENISKARKAFFALGGTGVFHGSLNPLSGRSIFESCILPILLYGCETWLLDTTSIKALEDFQCEIGKRILCLPKLHSKKVVRIALQWPSMTTRILIRKLTFLAKLLSDTKDIISGRIFTSLAVVDVYNVSIVQQCRMLESELGTHTLSACLENPPDAPTTVKSAKAIILKADLNALLSSSLNHPSAKYIADVATEISWCRLWDTALDHGVQGTRRLQLLLKELSRRLYDGFSCRSCNSNLNDNPSWLHHICSHHPEAVDNLSCEEIISALKEGNIYVLSTGANSKLSSIFSGT